MALFDSLLNDVTERFKLEDKAPALLTALLSFITSGQGGLGGFLNLFHRVGLGDVADSWVSRGANTPLSIQQTEDALGENTLANLAAQAGLPAAVSTSALSYLIPAVVDRLTPDGVVPPTSTLLSNVGNYLPAVGAVAALGGRAATRDIDNIETGAMAKDTEDRRGGSILSWVLPLLIVGLLGYVAYLFLARPNQDIARANVNRAAANTSANNANTAVAKPAAQIDPRLSIRAENGRYIVSGIVGSEAERNQIIEAMRRELGEANVDFTGLRVDANAKPIGWFAKFAELLPSLKGWTGGELTFIGENGLRAAGNIPQAVIDRIKILFAGWTLPAIFLGTGADAQKAANEQATQALAAADTAEEVVGALNLSIINFATGKADIPADNKAILQKAAEVLKTAPAGTVIEVGGHTDNVGDKAKNQKLSEERANAVRTELINLGVKAENLNAKGYGDTKPKADNKTEQGRFQNRRIEYTLNSGQ
jgi:OmpA-OmpF porin, OOP family